MNSYIMYSHILSSILCRVFIITTLLHEAIGVIKLLLLIFIDVNEAVII